MNTNQFVLHPPPAERVPTWTPDIWPENLLLMNACVKHGVSFHWTLGVLLIPLPYLETVLSDLDHQIRILGFDGFMIADYELEPRMEFQTNYSDDGLEIKRALVDIAKWPHDDGLWVEVYLLN